MLTDRVKPFVHWTVGHEVPRRLLKYASKRGNLQGRLITDMAGTTEAEVIELIEQIRTAGPTVHSPLGAITVSHAAVKEVLTGGDFKAGVPARIEGMLGRISDWSASENLSPVKPPSMLVTEPPDHTRYRKLVTRVFSAKAMENLRERTEQITAVALDGLDPTGPVDLVAQFCGPLPVTVISEILGVPAQDRDLVLGFGTRAGASLDVGLSWRTYREVEAALGQFDGWLTDHVRATRAAPRDDLLSQLIGAQEDGVGLTEAELKATAGLVLAAGFETTVNLLGSGIALLHDHPDQLKILQANPELWPNAVDEILRYSPPVLLTGRVCATETSVDGTRLGEGQIVTTVLAGANRDPEVFADPHRFDVTRENARDHVAFSSGRHYCLGASLARLEGEVGLRAFFERFPDVRLLPGARPRPTRILRGFAALPARLQVIP